MTDINTDNIIYDDQYSAGPLPIKYLLNDFNSSKYSQNNDYPVIGNARNVYVSSELERPIPTYTGRKYIDRVEDKIKVVTIPNYSLRSGDNPIDTTNGLILKTGFGLRDKKSGNDSSWRAYEIYGDASVNPVVVQNAGQFADPQISKTRGNLAGYNREINRYANGIGVIWPEGQQCGLSSRNLMINLANN